MASEQKQEDSSWLSYFPSLFTSGWEAPEQFGYADEGTPIINFFAHKGGVGKTTSCYYIAYMLAKKYKKNIIVIDGDAQCTLTEAMCQKAQWSENWRNDVPRGDIYSAIMATHEAVVNQTKIQPAELVKPDRFKEASANGGGLWLLPGSLRLSIIERQLSYGQDIQNRGSLNTIDGFGSLSNTVGEFRAMVRATAAHYKADMVFLDVGPSIAEVNKNFFWSSDYFVLPCAPDAYTKTSLATLESVLTHWTVEQEKLAAVHNNSSECILQLKPTPPKFLGIVVNRIQLHQGKPVKAAKFYINIIQQVVTLKLADKFDRLGMLRKKMSGTERQQSPFFWSYIPDFLRAMQISQRIGYPIYDMPVDKITDVDKEGNIVTASDRKQIKARADKFAPNYDAIAKSMALALDEDRLAGYIGTADSGMQM